MNHRLCGREGRVHEAEHVAGEPCQRDGEEAPPHRALLESRARCGGEGVWGVGCGVWGVGMGTRSKEFEKVLQAAGAPSAWRALRGDAALARRLRSRRGAAEGGPRSMLSRSTEEAVQLKAMQRRCWFGASSRRQAREAAAGSQELTPRRVPPATNVGSALFPQSQLFSLAHGQELRRWKIMAFRQKGFARRRHCCRLSLTNPTPNPLHRGAKKRHSAPWQTTWETRGMTTSSR